MRLLTHNLLQCHVKGCTTNNYPLTLKNIKYQKVEIQAEKATALFARMLSKLDYGAIKSALDQCGIDRSTLPEELPENAAENQSFLANLGAILMGTEVETGEMVCNGCQHVYPISDGIPNMLLNENEI
jgi:multifunctional methyltransferase subunit TRM112